MLDNDGVARRLSPPNSALMPFLCQQETRDSSTVTRDYGAICRITPLWRQITPSHYGELSALTLQQTWEGGVTFLKRSLQNFRYRKKWRYVRNPIGGYRTEGIK